jgi:hypothetical protein
VSQYVLLISWHILEPDTGLIAYTLCGRVPNPQARTSSVLPAGRSCESCLRIQARREQPNVDNAPVDEPVDNEGVEG